MLTVTNEDVLPAYLQRVSDFEDCLLATCTKENQCDAIVTRNKKDFLSFLVNFHNIMRSKSCFYFSNRLDESVESVYLDKFTDESRQIELLMIRKKVPVGYEWNYKTLVMGALNDNCMPISVLLDTAKIFKAKLIIYQEHCHDMMLDPAWEIVAEDILGFILV